MLADYGTIGGGGSDSYAYANHVTSDWGTVSGGQYNQAGDGLNDTHATVGGGYGNWAQNAYTTVSGGRSNSATYDSATIGGGSNNQADADYATIGGGGGSLPTNGNKVTDSWGTVGGGYNNRAGDDDMDVDDAPHATVAGGESNTAGGQRAAIAGGAFNTANSNGSTVGGGYSNDAGGYHATIGGGYDSTISSWYATIGGGRANSVSGEGATVPGGYSNEAHGNYSVAMGRNAHVLTGHRNSLVFGGSDAAVTESFGEGTVTMRAFGGYRLYTNSTDPATGVQLPANSGSWSTLSDRDAKHSFEEVQPDAILAALTEVPVQEWSYSGSEVRHLGPVSQDFYAAFGLGDDNRHISTVDADGVALAAIQALSAQNQDLAASNRALEQRVDDLEGRISALEAGKAALVPKVGAGLLPWAGGLFVAVAGIGFLGRRQLWGGGR